MGISAQQHRVATGMFSRLELELESNLHSNTIKIVNNLGMLLSAVQDIQISRELLIECPSKD